MQKRHFRWFTATVVLSAVVLVILGMTGKTTVQALTPSELDAFGGTGPCYIGRCQADQPRANCEGEDMYCVDYTNQNDCCIAYFPDSVLECTGGGGAGSHCCWSYGNAVCYNWAYCEWDGEECLDGYECGVEESDEQDCFT